MNLDELEQVLRDVADELEGEDGRWHLRMVRI